MIEIKLKSNNNWVTYMNEQCVKNNCIRHLRDNQTLDCDCGEEYYNKHRYGWYWFNDNYVNTVISNNNRDVLFHPVYSSGTAALRGNQAFEQNHHYYWEVKMTTRLYGTDVMVGVGTRRVGLSDRTYRFCSMLGMDSNSWGYSYQGKIQHNRIVRNYGSQYNCGSLVGVHLDTCLGTIEFYLNRKPLGIAYTGLKGIELYPMVCSTAAKSAMRITCSIQVESTLQLKCLQVIVNTPHLYKQYCDIKGLKGIYDINYFWLVPKTPVQEEDKTNKRKTDSSCTGTSEGDDDDKFNELTTSEDCILNCIKRFRKTTQFNESDSSTDDD